MHGQMGVLVKTGVLVQTWAFLGHLSPASWRLPPPFPTPSAHSSILHFFFLIFGGFTAAVYPLNSFQMGLCFSSLLYAGSAQRLPTSRCRAGRSICRGFGRAGCPAAPACISPGSAQLGPGAPHKHHLALAGPWSPSQRWQPVRMDG